MSVDPSTPSRRGRVAVQRGFVKNEEDLPGRPARYVLGQPRPDDVEILPTPAALADHWDRFTVSPIAGGVSTLPPAGQQR